MAYVYRILRCVAWRTVDCKLCLSRDREGRIIPCEQKGTCMLPCSIYQSPGAQEKVPSVKAGYPHRARRDLYVNSECNDH